jgi:hypothetical protein
MHAMEWAWGPLSLFPMIGRWARPSRHASGTSGCTEYHWVRLHRWGRPRGRLSGPHAAQTATWSDVSWGRRVRAALAICHHVGDDRAGSSGRPGRCCCRGSVLLIGPFGLPTHLFQSSKKNPSFSRSRLPISIATVVIYCSAQWQMERDKQRMRQMNGMSVYCRDLPIYTCVQRASDPWIK